ILPPHIASGLIAAGGVHGLALKVDNTVWAWGWDQYGQVGAGSIPTPPVQSTPVQVQGLPCNVIAISAGGDYSLALTSDGRVWPWGLNNYGQLGIVNYTAQHLPVQIPNLSGVTAISAGFYHAMALASDGLYAWGLNNGGQLGNGTTANSPVPVLVSGAAYYN